MQYIHVLLDKFSMQPGEQIIKKTIYSLPRLFFGIPVTLYSKKNFKSRQLLIGQSGNAALLLVSRIKQFSYWSVGPSSSLIGQ